jgi:hypothetical protein
MDVKAYAASVGRAARTVANEVWAAEVANVADVGNDLAIVFQFGKLKLGRDHRPLPFVRS